MTVPRKVGAPPTSPAARRKPQDGIVASVARGAAMPKPSVTLWSAKPITSTSAKATAPLAADWPIASPSERLCRPSPVAIIIASVLGAAGGAFLVRPEGRALENNRPGRPEPRPTAKNAAGAGELGAPRGAAAAPGAGGGTGWGEESQG